MDFLTESLRQLEIQITFSYATANNTRGESGVTHYENFRSDAISRGGDEVVKINLKIRFDV